MARPRLIAWLSWFLGRRSESRPQQPVLPERPERAQRADPSRSRGVQLSEEELLATYLRRIGVLDERPGQVDPAALAALERLWQSGKEELATRLGGALAEALPTDLELQLVVADLLWRQRFGEAAQPLLERIVESPTSGDAARRLRARWLLGELATARGEPEQAAWQLAQILAEDWDYPGARERLRAQQALRGGDGASELPAGQLPLGGESGLLSAPTLLGSSPQGASRFRLRRELGVGSSGTVYLAEDAALGIDVALKLFHAPPRRHRSAAVPLDERALHEARLLSSLRHPGVLFLYELDEDARYVTMEVCEGGSLRSRLEQGPLPPRTLLLRAIELCDTLRRVHELGVVHGDLKPENLLFRSPSRSLRALADDAPFGDLVLSDFGIARRLADGLSTTSAAGTLGYLAPERVHGAPPSPAVDLYALGVVLLEMGLARRPQSPLAQPQWLDEALAALPHGGLRELIGRLGAREPAARPPAAEALAVLKRLAEAA